MERLSPFLEWLLGHRCLLTPLCRPILSKDQLSLLRSKRYAGSLRMVPKI